MLDPLTALSLASAVAQFADFGLKTLKGSIELYYSADGIDAKRSDLEAKIQRLREIAEKVRLPLRPTRSEGSISSGEEELEYLARSCGLIASDLLSVLDSFKVKKPPGPGRKWESLQKAANALTPWNKDKVASLVTKLDSVKESMFQQLHFMMSERQSQVLMTLKDLGDDKLLQTKGKILEAIESLRQRSNVALADLSLQLSSLAEASRHQKIVCILNSLDFETRRSRESEIAEAEYHTFEWIFLDFHEPTKGHVGFRQWLLSGDDIYWISGKAGSGKSVLMNYIARAQKTRDMLQHWARNARLIIAKYFFWNAGAPMQKSQLGLLQTLLREICGHSPDLVPIVCPSHWSRCHDIGGTWTRPELLEAFDKLKDQQLLALRFCFFVDGVDEYDGEDYTHIIQVLKSLSASPSVKICLSSRPWNIFTAAFGVTTTQRLVLENFNKADIQKYITSRFEEDENFVALRSSEPCCQCLMENIIQNADGVFLWVRIVVANLLRGMSNDDSLSDLHQRLQSFPTTLTAYFEHIFDNIDDFYREETAEILLLCLEGNQPFSLLNFWFYEQEKMSPDYVLQAGISPLSRADVVRIFNSIHKQINARGQDLLIIEANMAAKATDLIYTVRFSHKAVKDFLSTDVMLKRLTAWKSKGFDAQVTLCNATLAIAQSLLPLVDVDVAPDSYDLEFYDELSGDISNWRRYTEDFFAYANILERNEAHLNGALIDAFEKCSSLFLEPNKQKMDLLSQLQVWEPMQYEDNSWSPSLKLRTELALSGGWSKLFLTLAVEANLKQYTQSKLATKLCLIEEPFIRRSILDHALQPSAWPIPRRKPDIEMIRILLTNGANPNETFFALSQGPYWHKYGTDHWLSSTVWGYFLQTLRYTKASGNQYRSSGSLRDEYEVAKLLIEYGAEADILIPNDFDDGPGETPLDIIRMVFPVADAIFLEQYLEEHKPRALQRAFRYLQKTVQKSIYLRWMEQFIQLLDRYPLIYHFAWIVDFIPVAKIFSSKGFLSRSGTLFDGLSALFSVNLFVSASLVTVFLVATLVAIKLGYFGASITSQLKLRGLGGFKAKISSSHEQGTREKRFESSGPRIEELQ